jgi:glycosyltransferase involved in cell wall biosynthesis
MRTGPGYSSERGDVAIVQAVPIRVAIDAHVVGRRGTGNETYIVNLISALMPRPDIEPLVIVDRSVRWPGADVPPLHTLRTRTPFMRIPIELPLAAGRLGAALLHVQYVAPPFTSIPVVTTIHDVSFEDVPGLFRRPTELRLKLSVRRSAKRSAAVVASSEYTKSRLIHHYGLDPDRVFVAPLAAAPRWRPLDQDERSRRLHGRALPGPFVLAVGNLHPRKNIPRLIRAVAALRRAGLDDLGLVLVGQRGWRAEEVDAAIDGVDGRTWVKFAGFVDDDMLQALYGEARVVAYPSLYEGFGLPALEALACGAIVVASNATAIPEAVGGAALLVDPTREEAIAEALRRAATDEQLRSHLVVAGPVHAAGFTWERCAEQTVVAYRAAVGGVARA